MRRLYLNRFISLHLYLFSSIVFSQIFVVINLTKICHNFSMWSSNYSGFLLIWVLGDEVGVWFLEKYCNLTRIILNGLPFKVFCIMYFDDLIARLVWEWKHHRCYVFWLICLVIRRVLSFSDLLCSYCFIVNETLYIFETYIRVAVLGLTKHFTDLLQARCMKASGSPFLHLSHL